MRVQVLVLKFLTVIKLVKLILANPPLTSLSKIRKILPLLTAHPRIWYIFQVETPQNQKSCWSTKKLSLMQKPRHSPIPEDEK